MSYLAQTNSLAYDAAILQFHTSFMIINNYIILGGAAFHQSGFSPKIHHAMNEPLICRFNEKPLWWKAASMKSRFNEKPLRWKAASMKSCFDEKLLRWKAALMKSCFDEKLLWWKAALMKSLFNEKPLQWKAASMKSRFNEKPLWWKAAPPYFSAHAFVNINNFHLGKLQSYPQFLDKGESGSHWQTH